MAHLVLVHGPHDADPAPPASGGRAEPDRGQVLVAQRGEVDVEFRVVRLGLEAELVCAVLAEPVDARRQIEGDVGQALRIDLSSRFQQLPHDLCDVQCGRQDAR
ncbi:hypothetical protein [Streptomyces aureus]|uniref:Uncharacterized protein n=1 Tax=Streptomyces aureus TaxID=193461 RepID=A0ABV4SVK6_9ACTN